MSDLQAIADRVEIEALHGEFTDAVMLRDYDRLASLFTHDGAVRMPHINAEGVGRQEIRAGIQRLQGLWDYFVQTTHPGTIQLAGDTASGRAYIAELGRFRDGSSHRNYAIYHDRYRRTPDGWKFTERVYEVRYLDTTPLAGSAPHEAGAPANPVGGLPVGAGQGSSAEDQGGSPASGGPGGGQQRGDLDPQEGRHVGRKADRAGDHRRLGRLGSVDRRPGRRLPGG
jgi:ketosteroid isomerase-like protein